MPKKALWPALNLPYYNLKKLEYMLGVFLQPAYEMKTHMSHQYFLDLCPSTNEIRFSRLRSNENRDFLG